MCLAAQKNVENCFLFLSIIIRHYAVRYSKNKKRISNIQHPISNVELARCSMNPNSPKTKEKLRLALCALLFAPCALRHAPSSSRQALRAKLFAPSSSRRAPYSQLLPAKTVDNG
jgi:hypothetical protein